MKVKSVETVKERFKSGATRAPAAYREATSKVTDFVAKATSTAAKENYDREVAAAIAAGRREKGIAKSGDEGYRKGCAEKGAAVIGTRMSAAADKQSTEWSPYRSILEGLEKKPRAATGRENVEANLMPIVERFEAKKKELKG